jgi:hypothetical protein
MFSENSLCMQFGAVTAWMICKFVHKTHVVNDMYNKRLVAGATVVVPQFVLPYTMQCREAAACD